MIRWKKKKFNELSTNELYSILKARVDVFVIEQACPYPEIDNFDQRALHLFLEEENEVVAYSRLFPSQVKYEEASLGRVLVAKSHRGTGLAKDLLKEALVTLQEEWNEHSIKIQAQEYLIHFYGSFGFQPISEVYLEDGIPHVDMILINN
jgi:ElaA protein